LTTQLQAAATQLSKPPKVAKPAGNNPQTFSLNFEPASHPFCEAGENQPDQNRRDESKLRPLLVRVDAITLIACFSRAFS